MRMIDEDEVGLKEKQKDYIEMKPEVPSDLFIKFRVSSLGAMLSTFIYVYI